MFFLISHSVPYSSALGHFPSFASSSFSSSWVPLPMLTLCFGLGPEGLLFLSRDFCSLQCFDMIFRPCSPFGLAGLMSLRYIVLHTVVGVVLPFLGRALCSYLLLVIVEAILFWCVALHLTAPDI